MLFLVITNSPLRHRQVSHLGLQGVCVVRLWVPPPTLWLSLTNNNNVFQAVESRLLDFIGVSLLPHFHFQMRKRKGTVITSKNCKAMYGFRGSGSFYLRPVKAQSVQDVCNETVIHLVQSLCSLLSGSCYSSFSSQI